MWKKSCQYQYYRISRLGKHKTSKKKTGKQ